MSTSPQGRRLVGFRLCDLSPVLLARGKEVAMRNEDSFVERLKIGLAAENPSTKVYWISAKAWNKTTKAVR